LLGKTSRVNNRLLNLKRGAKLHSSKEFGNKHSGLQKLDLPLFFKCNRA
jgi:hypothetical protein